jgi:hypothetical protein
MPYLRAPSFLQDHVSFSVVYRKAEWTSCSPLHSRPRCSVWRTGCASGLGGEIVKMALSLNEPLLSHHLDRKIDLRMSVLVLVYILNCVVYLWPAFDSTVCRWTEITPRKLVIFATIMRMIEQHAIMVWVAISSSKANSFQHYSPFCMSAISLCRLASAFQIPSITFLKITDTFECLHLQNVPYFLMVA